MEDVEKYLREMEVKRLQQKAMDKEEWELVITEAKAARGP